LVVSFLVAIAAAVPVDVKTNLVPVSSASDPVPNIWFVVFKNEVTLATINDMAEQFSARRVYNIGGTFKAFTAELTDELIEKLRLRTDVLRYIQQDSRVYAYGEQSNVPSWGIDRIDQGDINSPGQLDGNFTYPDTAGAGASVYVLDTGIRITHQEFNNNGVPRARWGATFTGDGDQDLHGHGTHCAGTAVGALVGVAKRANTVAVKVLGNSGSGSWEGVAAGIQWTVEDCISRGHPGLCVGSMSLGGGGNQIADDAVNAAVGAGVTIVVAAGNNAYDACFYSPARAAQALTVGATDNTDNRASYSNYGTCLEIFAPGSNIYSAYSSNDQSYTSMSGTSMACPHVAGGVALLASQHPGSTPGALLALLQTQGTGSVVNNPGAGSPNILLFTFENM